MIVQETAVFFWKEILLRGPVSFFELQEKLKQPEILCWNKSLLNGICWWWFEFDALLIFNINNVILRHIIKQAVGMVNSNDDHWFS